jgi:phosphatidylglycerophosphatase A
MDLWRKPVRFLAFGFGVGYLPYAPGTFGSLLALPLYLFWAQHLSAVGYALLVAALFVAGVGVCGRAERELGVADHPGIVWDEIVGQLVALAGAPAGWAWLALAFGLFRLFDIWKPFPIGWLNRRVHGGVGVMLDDVAAGAAAALCLQAMAWIATTN